MGRLSALVAEQSRAYVYAFDIEAPSDEVYFQSLEDYIFLAEQIQYCLIELDQIKRLLK